MVEVRDRAAALIAPGRGREGAVAAALQAGFGLGLPEMGGLAEAAGLILARTAPHQVLAMRDGEGLFEALAAALGDEAGVFDLSDARTGVVVRGAKAQERLRTLFPIDLRALQPGCCVQTVMSHLTVLLCQIDAEPTYELHCAASYRGSFLRALDLAGL